MCVLVLVCVCVMNLFLSCGGVWGGFRGVENAAGMADGGEGVCPRVVVEASLGQADTGDRAGGWESSQAGQAVPHVVQVVDVT